jgi:hypothetical protein
MRMQPNPPRVITILVAILLAAVGATYAWPIDVVLNVLAPLTDVASTLGLTLNQDFGYLLLFLSPSLLVAGSLLPGV